MSSSITTTLPVGPIPQWCLTATTGRAALFVCPELASQGATTNGTDYISICCDGLIVNTAFDIYGNTNQSTGALPFSLPNSTSSQPIELSDLLCCPITGTQTAVLEYVPGPDARTACAPGTVATPLAGFAATNASDARPFTVTWASRSASADPEMTVTNNLWGWAAPTYGASGTPVCLWADTASVSVAEVTVPVSYVAPSTTSGSSSSTTSPSSAATPLRSLDGLGLLVLVLLLAWCNQL
ncbi:hypothetical protein F5B19DRAFT_168384 [Rostrohypoxylon terebratum]|nr:hypothetical protein F5B19DRAFT_168384 [Rostrohypoxylon terebratum]